jgi:hypothetical protein
VFVGVCGYDVLGVVGCVFIFGVVLCCVMCVFCVCTCVWCVHVLGVCVCVCVLCVCACVWNVHVQYYMVLVRVFASVWSRDVVVWWCVHVSVCLCVWECACAILRYDVLMMYSL